jgi:hypothetical protein
MISFQANWPCSSADKSFPPPRSRSI